MPKIKEIRNPQQFLLLVYRFVVAEMKRNKELAFGNKTEKYLQSTSLLIWLQAHH